MAERSLNWAVALLVTLRCAWVYSVLLRAKTPPLGLAQDDFYYYLKPAQNLAWHGHATFFQHVLTNGFHPLYFALLTAVSFRVHTLPGVFRFLWLLDIGSTLAIFLCARALFRRVATALLSNALAVLVAALCLTQICDQMEVTLALPLGFAFLLIMFVPEAAWTSRRAAWSGLLAGLLFLARLDAVLLVLLYLGAALCYRSTRRLFRPSLVVPFLASSLPLPMLYLALNLHFFGVLLPVSGMAKELRHGFAPSLLLLASFNGTSEALLVLTLGSLVVLFALRKHFAATEKVLLLATLSCPFVFYGLNAVLSDWQLWNWYFYVLRFSAAGVAMLLALIVQRRVIPAEYTSLRAALGSPAFSALLLALFVTKLMVAKYRVDVVMLEIERASGILNQFSQTHPGVYAMGDRAGMFALQTSSPVLQTEGLMMDKRYLLHVRREDDLAQTLRTYGVNYYVAFVFNKNLDLQWRSPCFYAMEPTIAGPSALRMRSTLCMPPVYTFAGGDGRYFIFQLAPA